MLALVFEGAVFASEQQVFQDASKNMIVRSEGKMYYGSISELYELAGSRLMEYSNCSYYFFFDPKIAGNFGFFSTTEIHANGSNKEYCLGKKSLHVYCGNRIKTFELQEGEDIDFGLFVIHPMEVEMVSIKQTFRAREGEERIILRSHVDLSTMVDKLFPLANTVGISMVSHGKESPFQIEKSYLDENDYKATTSKVYALLSEGGEKYTLTYFPEDIFHDKPYLIRTDSKKNVTVFDQVANEVTSKNGNLELKTPCGE